ncbi:unnamed protein product [Mytilus edulis]|uniref:DZIP3-like HEPN domain-containing protein n=1 Tax=Mytilus edulis TaxID=6550 RepID=A0A8S3SWI6_MYTED|nr:unnamed protein product [Mytilus edulis]
MAPLSEEEENYVRLALLLKGVTPRAVRTYFDREFPPTSLPSTLNTNYNTLLDLKLKRIINQAQWNLLIPRNGIPDSKTFDVTLMICLIRNLTSISSPINGFDSLPLPGETTPGSDLARMKFYRNKLAHHDSNTIDATYFHTAWTDISNVSCNATMIKTDKAVGRLGGETMYQECKELKEKILDQSNHEIVLEIKQSLKEMKELRKTIDILGTEHTKVTENLRELQSSYITLKTSQNTLQAEHIEVRESLKDPIPSNIKVRLLLERNPVPCDNTPLSTSYVNNNISISNSPSLVQPLLKHKPDVNAQTYDGGNALYFSALDGNIEITQLLLENNADSNICIHSKQYITDALTNHPSITLDKEKQDLFDSLVKNTSSRVTEYVRNKSVEYAFDVVAGSSPLHIACFMGRTDIVHCIMDHNATINLKKEDGTTPLFYACELGHTDIVRLLLHKGADLRKCRKDVKSPLDIATHNGHTSINGYSPLIQASYHGHTDIVRLLLERNPDPCDNTSLSTSYVYNNISISNSPSLVQPLMKHKPDINAQTYDGGNALYFSALFGHIEITQLLLENNAYCNICIYRLKQSIFDSLVKNTSSRVTEYVSNKSVEYAFDVVAGSSPLHIACFMGRTDIVHCIMDHNANINLTKEDGTTPLFYACELGHADIVRLLLHKGADLRKCRKDVKSPLDIATHNGHTSIVLILTEYMK